MIGLVGAHGDAFELLELAEEVFDEMPPFVHLLVDGERLCAQRMLGDDDLGASKANPSMSGGTPTVSKRCPGRSTKRTRLPSASVRARILVVMPPFERPIAWFWVPLLRPVRGGGP